MKSMCHFAAKIPAPHDYSNMLKIHAGPRNPQVMQSLIRILRISSSALFEYFMNNSFNHYSTFFLLSISFGGPYMIIKHEKTQIFINLTSFETFW